MSSYRRKPNKNQKVNLRTLAGMSVGLVILGAIVIVLSLSGREQPQVVKTPASGPTMVVVTAMPYTLSPDKVCDGEVIMGVDQPLVIPSTNFDIEMEVEAIAEGPDAYVILHNGLKLRVGDGVPDRHGNIVGIVTAIDDALHFCQIKDKQ